jgi:hypothetical protein
VDAAGVAAWPDDQVMACVAALRAARGARTTVHVARELRVVGGRGGSGYGHGPAHSHPGTRGRY